MFVALLLHNPCCSILLWQGHYYQHPYEAIRDQSRKLLECPFYYLGCFLNFLRNLYHHIHTSGSHFLGLLFILCYRYIFRMYIYHSMSARYCPVFTNSWNMILICLIKTYTSLDVLSASTNIGNFGSRGVVVSTDIPNEKHIGSYEGNRQTSINPRSNIQHKTKFPVQIRFIYVRKAYKELILLYSFDFAL